VKRSKMKPSSFALPKQKKYPVNTLPRARNAIARVQQNGSPTEKAAVFSAVRRKYPALAARSTVVPTKTGTGRHYGEPPGTRHGKGKKR
jgi:hypothetical protein